MGPESFTPPSSLLIIGSGAFGLSTAFALAKRPEWSSTAITIVDRSAESFPSPDASSVDSSRIVRADYADRAYSALATAAQVEWRKPGKDSWGGEGRYTETGFVIVADEGPLVREDGLRTGMGFTKSAYANALELEKSEGVEKGISVVELKGREAIKEASKTGASFGDWGYINRRAGWADAEASMKFLYEQVLATRRVKFVGAAVERLEIEGKKVTGARLQDGTPLKADLVMVAAGAWTPSLVDLRGQAVATGQALGYTDITEEEQKRLGKVPTLMNVTHATFMITPHNRVLKIGRHGYGYMNPKKVATALVVPKSQTDPAFPEITVSQPYTHLDDAKLWVPAEAELALRQGLRNMAPWPELQDRPWTRTKICWYTDTATGDFLITYHPHWDGLFIATGGSGHGFKFLPVLGDKIADVVMKKCPVEFQDKWEWREATDIEKAIVTEDGSRGGPVGLILMEELRKQGPRL
ncbi:putative fructosyl amino acid protein [Xylariales sp. AK1849]|nr:putative fructosyl amino acid protein [Xylariales sp. AK1849]